MEIRKKSFKEGQSSFFMRSKQSVHYIRNLKRKSKELVDLSRRPLLVINYVNKTKEKKFTPETLFRSLVWDGTSCIDKKLGTVSLSFFR